MLTDFVINIAASIVFFFIGYFANHIRQELLLSPMRRIWKSFLKDKESLVILSTRPGPYPRSTLRVSFSEMQAYVEVNSALSKLGVTTKPSTDDITVDKLRTNNIVILGSTVANKIAVRIWEDVSETQPFVFHQEEQYFSIRNRKFAPVTDKSGVLVKDYGIIIRQVNPYNCQKSMVFAMGCHGFSTYGCVRMMCDLENIKKLLSATGNKNFVALIEMDLRDKQIVTSRVVECYIPVSTATK